MDYDMKNRWLKLTCAGLALLMLSLTAIACPAKDNGNAKVPEVTLKRVASNNLNLPGEVVTNIATPEDGAIVVNGNLRLSVPPGAVSAQAPVTIKRCTQTPAAMTSAKADAKQVIIMSDLYDVGPDNIQFNKPVQVTIPYDETLLPAGSNESQIGPIFFDGQNWVPLERDIDTVNNLVSFQTKSFPGSWLLLGATAGSVGWPVYVAVGAVGAVAWYFAAPAVKSQIKQDPVFWGNAASYVTPKDPTVQKWAGFMKIGFIGDNKNIDVKDLLNNPEALQRFNTNVASKDCYIQCVDGTAATAFNYQTTQYGENWKMPADFFNSNLTGDCKNVANAMASVFRYYGYTVKCVDGYSNGARHGWAELIIDGKPYYVGAHAEIMPLDKAIKEYNLARSLKTNGASSMWDEKGQKPYKSQWWLTELKVAVDKTKAYPGGQVVIDVLGAAGISLDINLTLANPDDSETKYKGTTDKETGIFRLTIPLKKDALPGAYIVSAFSTFNEQQIVGADIFYVEIPVLTANMITSQYAPGDTVIINVNINPPLETRIEVQGLDGRWMTDKDGFAFPSFPIAKDAKPGNYSFVINAPLIGLSTTVPFTVTLPPGLTVNISPSQAKPGDVIVAKVSIQPPAIAKITVKGYDGRWQTDKNGIVSISLPVSKTVAPGKYELVVQAPDLALAGSATYTVALAQVNTAVNAVVAQLTIGAEGSNDTGDYEASLTLSGYTIKGTLDGNYEVHATGRANSDTMDIYYDFIISKDLTKAISGSVSVIADSGENSYFEFSNLPRNTDFEANMKTDNGLDCIAFGLTGTAVTGHYSTVNVQDPALGNVTRYFANENSEILVVLFAASDEQLQQLLEN